MVINLQEYQISKPEDLVVVDLQGDLVRGAARIDETPIHGTTSSEERAGMVVHTRYTATAFGITEEKFFRYRLRCMRLLMECPLFLLRDRDRKC
jgi:ribulose-5-phosphate 4-epimerase/fuculose-1-phosphate aldolase